MITKFKAASVMISLLKWQTSILG